MSNDVIPFYPPFADINKLPTLTTQDSILRRQEEFVFRDASPRIVFYCPYDSIFTEPNILDYRLYPTFYPNPSAQGMPYPYRIAAQVTGYPQFDLKANYDPYWEQNLTTYYPSATQWLRTTVDPNTMQVIFTFILTSYNTAGGVINSRSWNMGLIGYQPPKRGTVTTNPASGAFETVTINWSGFQQGKLTTIRGYYILYQESTDNVTWGATMQTADIPSTALSGSYTWSGGTRGRYYRFNVVAYNEWNQRSDATIFTPSIRKNSPPNVPGNPRYASPTPASDGTPASIKAYVPESVAAFIWDVTGDPDGQAVTYEVQPLVRNADNTAWINDGGVLETAANVYSFPIASKPRGSANAVGNTPTSLFYQVRAKDTFGIYSSWAQPYYAYQRNPTIANAGINGAFQPGIVNVGMGGQWIKGEIYTGADGQWLPGQDLDY